MSILTQILNLIPEFFVSLVKLLRGVLGMYGNGIVWGTGGAGGVYAYEAQLAQHQKTLGQPQKPTKGKSMLNHLRDYFGKNRDLIFNVAIIILVDHFVFNGAFREKIKSLLDKFLCKTHEMLDAKKGDSDAGGN